MNNFDINELEDKLLYKFNDISILKTSLQHSSYVNEHLDENMKDNECLEFLGDAVLNLIIGHILMKRHPDLKEGDLSRMRAGLVNEFQLAAIAKTLYLGSFIRLGKGEIQTNGHEKNSILSDTLEAITAAVYLDGGFEAAFKIIEIHFSSHLNAITTPDANFDFKSQLQELVQLKQKITPTYEVTKESGPDHDKTFKVIVKIKDHMIEGTGKSKKSAEQDAARNAFEFLKNE